MPLVFTPNFLRCLVNSLKERSTYLHAAAQKAVDRIGGLAEREGPGAAQVRVAAALALQRYGGAGFDALSKTKVTTQLLQVRPLCPPCLLASSNLCFPLLCMVSFDACSHASGRCGFTKHVHSSAFRVHGRSMRGRL